MFSLLFLAVVAQAPPVEKVLVLDFAGDVALEERRTLADAFAALLHERVALDVAPASSLRDRLRFQADRDEAGCDDGSCAAEAADAIGARFVVFARVGKTEQGLLMRIEAFDGRDARTISVVTMKGDSITSLSLSLPRAADELIDRSDGAFPRREKAAPIIEAPGFFDRPGNTGVVVGSALLVVGVASAVLWAIPAYIGDERNGALQEATSGYVENPSVSEALDVREARADVDDIYPLQVAASPLFLVALIGIPAGALVLGAGVMEMQ